MKKITIGILLGIFFTSFFAFNVIAVKYNRFQITDTDNDGILDESDNCVYISNPDQINTDGDSQGDACDPDNDNDGIHDLSDNCPLIVNANQDNYDLDGLGDVCDEDDDNDAVLDYNDNCVLSANDALLISELKPNHFANVDVDAFFEARDSKSNALYDSKYLTTNTFGCSCSDILAKKSGEDNGQKKYGCTSGTLENFMSKPATKSNLITGNSVSASSFKKNSNLKSKTQKKKKSFSNGLTGAVVKKTKTKK